MATEQKMGQDEMGRGESTTEIETTMGESTRRDFLKATVAVAGVLVAGATTTAPAEAGGMKKASGVPVPNANTKKMVAGSFPKPPVMATGRVIGANDRLIIGFVGVGGMGGTHVLNFAKDATARNIQIGGICDVYAPRLAQRVGWAKENNAVSASFIADKDYRRLLENKDIDAIIVATPEHWHAQVACHAMEAGKHVYIQKPMTRYIDEAFQVYDTAKRTKRVVQVGSQGCTDARFHAAADAIRAGKLGRLIMAQDSYCREISHPEKKPIAGEWNYGIPADLSPQTLDWDLWLGSAPNRPFATKGGANDGDDAHRDDAGARFARYRKYSDYSAGIMGDLMPHRLHPLMLASGNPEFPSRVMAMGIQHLDDREVPDTMQMTAYFPSGWAITFLGSTINEQGLPRMIRGEKGTMYLEGKPEIRPERKYSEEVEGGPLTVNGPDYETHENHERNWLEAIRANDPMKANCNYELATKVQTVISLAEMSLRQNKIMLFDAATRKITTG